MRHALCTLHCKPHTRAWPCGRVRIILGTLVAFRERFGTPVCAALSPSSREACASRAARKSIANQIRTSTRAGTRTHDVHRNTGTRARTRTHDVHRRRREHLCAHTCGPMPQPSRTRAHAHPRTHANALAHARTHACAHGHRRRREHLRAHTGESRRQLLSYVWHASDLGRSRVVPLALSVPARFDASSALQRLTNTSAFQAKVKPG
jgi:hypothetical protein